MDADMIPHDCRDSFKFYVAQDAHFLAAFCQAYAAAAQKAAAQQQLEHVAVLQRLQQGIKAELQLHASYATVCMLQCALERPLSLRSVLSPSRDHVMG